MRLWNPLYLDDWRWWTLVAVPGFLFLTLLLEAPYVGYELLSHGSGTMSAALTIFATCWFFWLLLCPLLFWMLCKWPIEGPEALRKLALHVAAALAFVSAHLLLHAAVDTAGWFEPDQSFRDRYAQLLRWNGPLELIIFVMIDGLFHSVRFAIRGRILTQQKVAAELEALRRQLEPHFLFNALNSLCATLPKTGPARAMAMRLSEYLRLVLDRTSSETVTLGDELSLVRAYVDVERMRHGQRLKAEFSVSALALRQTVPVMVLQPLVENAIRHATSVAGATAEVGISAEVGADRLVLSVANSPAPVGDHLSGAGRGLSIVRDRLSTTYGGNAQLLLERSDPGSFIARVVLPLPQSRK